MATYYLIEEQIELHEETPDYAVLVTRDNGNRQVFELSLNQMLRLAGALAVHIPSDERSPLNQMRDPAAVALRQVVNTKATPDDITRTIRALAQAIATVCAWQLGLDSDGNPVGT